MTTHTPCPVCREIHGPSRTLSFDGKGVNSCGMHRTRIATFAEADDTARILGPMFAAVPETAAKLAEVTAERDRLREVLSMVLTRLDLEPIEAVFPCSAMRDTIRDALASTTPPAPDPLRDAAPDLLACLQSAESMLRVQVATCRNWAKVRDEKANNGLADEYEMHANLWADAIAKAEDKP